MSMELTEKILQSAKGYLGITVKHPSSEGELRVVGISTDPVEYGWTNMPDAMRVKDRKTYCCRAEGRDEPIFVFEDEITVVDAPAHVVVGAMLDRIADIHTERALTPYDVVDILEGRSLDPDEWDEDED